MISVKHPKHVNYVKLPLLTQNWKQNFSPNEGRHLHTWVTKCLLTVNKHGLVQGQTKSFHLNLVFVDPTKHGGGLKLLERSMGKPAPVHGS